MSENLDPDPVAVPPVPVAAPAEPPVVPVAPADPDEAAAVDISGAKMVPLAALKAAREEARTAKEQARELESIKTAWNQARPTIEFLQQNPQFMTGRPPEPVAPAPAAPDPELVELARSLDYYKQDGSPDVARAEKHMQIIDRRAAQKAAQLVGPVQQSTHLQRAEVNWGAAVQEKLPNGQPIDAGILAEVWRPFMNTPDGLAQLADPRVVRVVVNQAKMMQMERSPLRGAPTMPAANPPLVTEPAGNAPPRPRVALTDLDRAVAAAKGMTEARMAELTKDYVKGRPTVLED